MPLGDLEIQADYQLLKSHSGQCRRLRRKELQLLRFLAHNLNSVINKYALIDLIWRHDGLNSGNTLEVHLSRLRHKLRELSAQVRIDTIRGVGYRLVADGNK